MEQPLLVGTQGGWGPRSTWGSQSAWEAESAWSAKSAWGAKSAWSARDAWGAPNALPDADVARELSLLGSLALPALLLGTTVAVCFATGAL